MANLCLSVGITCFLCGTTSEAQHVTNRPIRAVIIQHVAFGAIPSCVPVTALPSCFSFSCRWPKLRCGWNLSGIHNSKPLQTPSGDWLKAGLCGKRFGNHNSKTPHNPLGNWLKTRLCGKRFGDHNSKTPQTSPREWVESSAVWKIEWKS